MMHRSNSRPRRASVSVWSCVLAGLVLHGLGLSAAETVKITLPAAISFSVTDVGLNTGGSPSPTTISFSNGTLLPIQSLRISVIALSDFVPPSGTAIPAANVSWTTSGATHGTGANGVLSTSAYVQVYQSTILNLSQSGSVDVTWTLAAPGTPLVAGNHVLTMRWKLEAI
jgi:hypothetical protein